MGCVRLLARALSDSAPALAGDEARSALAVFRALGAVRAVNIANELLRGFGSSTASRPRTERDCQAPTETAVAHLPEPRPQPVTQEPNPRCPP